MQFSPVQIWDHLSHDLNIPKQSLFKHLYGEIHQDSVIQGHQVLLQVAKFLQNIAVFLWIFTKAESIYLFIMVMGKKKIQEEKNIPVLIALTF